VASFFTPTGPGAEEPQLLRPTLCRRSPLQFHAIITRILHGVPDRQAKALG